MLKYLCLFILSLFIETAFAQNDSTIYYLKSSGKLVSTRDSADIYAVARPSADSAGNKIFTINGYFLKGSKIYTFATLTNTFPFKPEGRFFNYHPNGKIQAVRNFKDGQPTGNAFEYFPNGNLCTRLYYLKDPSGRVFVRYMDCRDSTGKVLAENGNGNWIFYNNNYTDFKERGPVLNGMRDSTWIIKTPHGEIKAIYKEGKLAPRLNNAGEPIFTAVEQEPEFPGGLTTFSKFLSQNIVYPKDASLQGIHGRVMISFVVEMDGSLSDIKVVRGIGGGCDEEALRVMKMCPKWRPGIQNGHTVRVAYTVPIAFSLN